jgi:hypothetical protein
MKVGDKVKLNLAWRRWFCLMSGRNRLSWWAKRLVELDLNKHSIVVATAKDTIEINGYLYYKIHFKVVP